MKNQMIVIDDQDIRTVEIDGSLDAPLSAELEIILSQASASKNKKTIVDLRKVPELTSHGVRVLLNASIHQSDILGLKNPNKEVVTLMKTVGLDHLIIE